MPQMAPAMWLLLYLFFLGSLALFCSSLYFSLGGSPASSGTSGATKSSVTWGW